MRSAVLLLIATTTGAVRGAGEQPVAVVLSKVIALERDEMRRDSKARRRERPKEKTGWKKKRRGLQADGWTRHGYDRGRIECAEAEEESRVCCTGGGWTYERYSVSLSSCASPSVSCLSLPD